MSSDSTDEPHHHEPPPSLHKAGSGDAPTGTEPHGSIWEPLDGSAPRFGPAQPAYRVPPAAGRPGFPGRGQEQAPPPPHRVAAAYAQVAQAAGTFTLAGWWARCWAFLIDTVIFGAGVIALTLVAATAAGMTIADATTYFASGTVPKSIHDPWWLYLVLVVGRLLLGILPAIFLVRWNGQTPGKRLLGLRVMRGSAEPMTLRVALRREVLARVILLQVATLVTLGLGPLLNYLWPLWDGQRRAGHDLFADTRVVAEGAKR